MRRLAALALAGLVLAGCGGDSKNDTGEPSQRKAATPQATSQATQTPQDDGSLKDLSTKPAVKSPGGTPPSKLVVKDIVKGKGKKAKPGDTVSVQYVGINYSNGQQFDASWDRGEPFAFQLGAQQVIPGWDRGIKGMRVGGRRELTIPPDLAYGPAGSGPIGPNETLIFVVDLKKIG